MQHLVQPFDLDQSSDVGTKQHVVYTVTAKFTVFVNVSGNFSSQDLTALQIAAKRATSILANVSAHVVATGTLVRGPAAGGSKTGRRQRRRQLSTQVDPNRCDTCGWYKVSVTATTDDEGIGATLNDTSAVKPLMEQEFNRFAKSDSEVQINVMAPPGPPQFETQIIVWIDGPVGKSKNPHVPPGGLKTTHYVAGSLALAVFVAIGTAALCFLSSRSLTPFLRKTGDAKDAMGEFCELVDGSSYQDFSLRGETVVIERYSKGGAPVVLDQGGTEPGVVATWAGKHVVLMRQGLGKDGNVQAEDVVEAQRLNVLSKNMNEEKGLYMNLVHDNIVRCWGCHLEPRLMRLTVVTERAQRGSLAGLMDRGFVPHCHGHRGGLVLAFAHDVASGLAFLHEQRPSIIHRDVKASNILISQDWRAKLSNFAFSRTASLESAVMTQVGSPFWTAPEILRNQAYDQQVDVYSYAITLLEVLSGSTPWAEQIEAGRTVVEIVFKVSREQKRPRIPEDIPPELRALITSCWEHDPSSRHTMEQVKTRLEEMGCVIKHSGKAPTPFDKFRAANLRNVKCGSEPNDRSVRTPTNWQREIELNKALLASAG